MLDLLKPKAVADITQRLVRHCQIDAAVTQSTRGKTWEYPVNSGCYLTLDELCRQSTCAKATIVQRLNRGWDIAKAIETPTIVVSTKIRRGASRTYVVGDRLLTAHQIEKAYGINADTFAYRIAHGWTIDEALGLKPYEASRKTTDVRPNQTRTWTYLGHEMPLRELIKHTNIDKGTLLSRLNAGWSVEDALTVPVRRKGAA